MFDAAQFDIRADRYTPNGDTIIFKGFDFTGATLKMEIRDRLNGGTVLATASTSLTVGDYEGVTSTTVTWSVSEVNMEAMPLSDEADADVTLYYDLHITPTGVNKFVAARGKFIVVAGATQ